VLYGEYPVERDLGVTDDRPAGLDGEAWHQDAAGGAFGLDRVGDPLGEGGDVRAPLTGAVRQRVPAGEAQLGQTAQLRETLRDLAEAGNETALDRLADLADADGDLEELSGLLDEDPCTPGSCSPDAHSRRVTCASCNGSPMPGSRRPVRNWSGS
jgi:hypothetical protein